MSDPLPPPTQPRPAPVELGYESVADDAPPGPRPWWVWVVVVLYALLATAIVSAPAVWVLLVAGEERGLLIVAGITSAAMTLCGLGLLFTPVRVGRRRRVGRGSVWIPISAAGFLLGVLVMFGTFALEEWARGEAVRTPVMIGAWIGGGSVWAAWSSLMWFLTRRRDPTAVASKLHRWLIGGSVAELLVAVPTHLVVRQRPYCCAGFYTGSAIAMGVAVMVIAFGPGVAFLYYKRWRQLRPSTAAAEPK